jgi:hypothetical protein
VLYVPSEGNKEFKQSTWNEDIEENIFIHIKNHGSSISVKVKNSVM